MKLEKFLPTSIAVYYSDLLPLDLGLPSDLPLRIRTTITMMTILITISPTTPPATPPAIAAVAGPEPTDPGGSVLDERNELRSKVSYIMVHALNATTRME